MRNRYLNVLVLVVAFGTLSLRAADDPKNPPAAVDASKLQPGEFLGRLLAPPGNDGLFTIRIDLTHLELRDPAATAKNNAKLNGEMQKIKRMQDDLARAKNPSQQQIDKLANAVARVQADSAKAQKNQFKVVPASKDVEFKAADAMVVRFLNPPVVYDDKGELKKWSKAELKALRGTDMNVPGYAGAPADLQSGQIIKVTLRERPTSHEATTPVVSLKDRKEGDPKPAATGKMEAAQVLIVIQDDMTPSTAKPAKKK